MVSSKVSPVPSASLASRASRSPLARMLDALRASLVRFQATFDAARVRRAELAPFASPEAVVRALEAPSSMSGSARYELVAAVASEHAAQAAGPALWSGILIVAYRPLLLRTRARLGRPEDTERDAQVLAAFVEALARANATGAGDYAAVAIQRAFGKALLRSRTGERQEAEHAAFDEDEHTRCEPHALTLGDACADLAWAEARERKLAAIPRWKSERAPPAERPLPSPSRRRPQLSHHDHATVNGVSP